MSESADNHNAGKQSSGLAIAGLVLGIIAAVTSFLPIINNISFFIGIIGGVFALIALIGAVRGKHAAKGLSVAGLVLAIVSCAIVLVTQSAYKAAIDKAVDDATSGSKPVATSAANADADKDKGGATDKGDSADKGGATDKEDSKGKNSSDKDGDATSNDDEAESADDTDYLNLAVGQTVTLGDGLSVTVNSTSTETASYGDTKVVCINVTYANDGSGSASFNTYDWKGEDANGAQRGPTFFMDSTDELSSGKLSDGGTVTGNIYFEEGVTRVLYYSNMFNDSATAGWTL